MFDDDFQRIDDGEAFVNTLVHFGQGFIDHWLEYRANHLPALQDRDFLPVLDGVRKVLGRLLGPEEIKELWDYLCWVYLEDVKAKNPKASRRACEAVLEVCLPEWHRLASEIAPPSRPKKSRGRKGKQ
jgi:hypothetical protein